MQPSFEGRALGGLQRGQQLSTPWFPASAQHALLDVNRARRHFQQKGVAGSLQQQGLVGSSDPWHLQLVVGAVCKKGGMAPVQPLLGLPRAVQLWQLWGEDEYCFGGRSTRDPAGWGKLPVGKDAIKKMTPRLQNKIKKFIMVLWACSARQRVPRLGHPARSRGGLFGRTVCCWKGGVCIFAHD